MKGKNKAILFVFCAVLWLFSLSPAVVAEGSPTEFVVLSTTDMHGKCWETDLLTGGKVPHNMLRVSTAVKQIRDAYGPEHVLLIDNGDLFQGTPVSEDHLLHAGKTEDEPEAMALCLTEIGYDALVLGNHEFNYPWEVMRRTYERLEKDGVQVLAANAFYDGSDGAHQEGEHAFGAYLVRKIEVNGHPHKVGVLGLENTDITRWDLPVNYPGIRFSHPDNPEYDLSLEAARSIARMLEDGCEMIIVSYHGGLGGTDEKLVFGLNSDHQGMRILQNTSGIDLMILGHDHSSAYSCTTVPDKTGREVPIVNGGGKDVTKTVFRLSEDAHGRLVCELAENENLDLDSFPPDPGLQEKIRPYAERANAALDLPVGRLTGEWDGSVEFFTAQSDTIDLVNGAMMAIGTERMREKYGLSGLEALKNRTGLDHLDVDAAFSAPVSGGFIPQSGPISSRDVHSLYPYANKQLILPMYGRELLEVLEDNAAQKLACRVLRGTPYFLMANDRYTCLVCGGVSFRCDLSKPAGERVTIEGFASGRAFEPDALYLVAVNNYLLGNERCALRAFSAENALWSQLDEENEDTIQEMIKEYIVRETERAGGLSPEIFTWKWTLVCPEDPSVLSSDEGRTVAVLADRPQDGHQYVLYHEAQGCALTGRSSGDGLEVVKITRHGDRLVDALPGDVLVLTAHETMEGSLMFTVPDGRCLASGESGGLLLTDVSKEDRPGLWQLMEADCGYYVLSAGASNRLALQYYDRRVTTYRLDPCGLYLFNFYEVTDPAAE